MNCECGNYQAAPSGSVKYIRSSKGQLIYSMRRIVCRNCGRYPPRIRSIDRAEEVMESLAEALIDIREGQDIPAPIIRRALRIYRGYLDG